MIRDGIESILSENSSAIAKVESTLRSLTWFLPGRFKDAELASESLTTSLDLLTLLNDNILSSKIDSKPNPKYLLPPSLQARYTRAWCQRSQGYLMAANTLQVLRFTQLFFEMLLHRKVSRRSRWMSIVILESIKCCLRLTLVSITRRPLIYPHVPQIADFLPLEKQECIDSCAIASSNQVPPHLTNNRIPFGSNGSAFDSSIEKIFRSGSLHSLSGFEPTQLLLPFKSTRDLFSEILYILRPLIYVVLMTRSKRNTRIEPLSLALMLDIISRWIRRRPRHNASLERDECSRRDRELLWYLLRGEIWQGFTRPKLQQLMKGLSRLPLIGVLGIITQEWFPLIDTYYYYASS